MSYDVEPFLPNILSHTPPIANASIQPSAYPPSRSALAILPLNLYFAWALESESPKFIKAILDSSALISAQAQAEGQDFNAGGPSGLYPNYAIAGTPIESIYGTANLQRMRAVKARVDPNSIMALAGGFKI